MKIRTYDQQYSGQGAIQAQRADAGDFGGGVADANAGLGDSMNKTAGVLTELANAKDQVWRNNAVSSFQLQQFQSLQAAKTDPEFAKKYGADGGGFSAGFGEQLTKVQNDLVASAPTLHSQQQLQMQLNGVTDGLMGHAIQFQAETGGQYMKDQLTQSMQNDAKYVAQSPGDTSAVLDRGKTAIANAPYLTPEHKSELLKTYEQNIAFAAGKGMVLHQPERVLAAIAPDVLSTFKPTARVLANTAIPVTSFQGTVKTSPALAQYSPLINAAASKHTVDANFMHAQIDQESHGDPNAVNNADIAVTGSPSVGIGQFQPATAAQYGVVDPKDPKQAIPGVAAYDADLLKQFGGDYRKVAAAYNWGPGNLSQAIATYGDKWFDHVPASTQNYINKIFTSAPPVPTAEASLQSIQDQTANAEPSRASTNPDWFNKLNWEQQFQIVHEAEQGVRANQVRDSQTLALQGQQKKKADQETMNGMFDRIDKPENPLTVAEVRASSLDYQGKEHMITAIQQGLRGEAKTNPTVFDDLFNRIHAPDGDPQRITDDRALLPYMGNGVSFDDINKLRGELKGKNTPDGATQAELKKNLFAMAKKQIDTSIFGVSIDTEGAKNFYNFQQAALSAIDKKTRAGADVLSLYDPKSKDYIGSLIPLYTRTPQQQGADVAKAMGVATQAGVKPGSPAPTPKTIVPRQPGESAADYLKRKGTMQ